MALKASVMFASTPAVASVVVEYDPKQISPADWETLVRGDAVAAGDLLNQWLARYGQLLRNSL
jgi:hypothetical protein